VSLAIDIDRLRVAARLTGQADHAGLLDRRLRQMLVDGALPMTSEDDASLGQETILCLPDLSLRLQMTLEEALSGECARRWSAAFLEALRAKLERGEGVWRFENRWDFLATYLRARLALADTPARVFAGLATLDLLSPTQAARESMREWPEIWPWLGQGDQRAAADVVRALRVRGGEAVLIAILRDGVAAGPRDGTFAGWDVPSLGERLRRLAESPPAALVGALPEAPSGQIATLAVYLALCVADAAEPARAPETGLFLSLLARASLPVAAESASLGWAERLASAVHGLSQSLRGPAQEMAEAAIGTPGSAERLEKLADVLRGQAFAPRAEPRTPPARPMADFEADDDARVAEARASMQVFRSPIGGAALCLPLLAENRIGREFPATVRLEALARLGSVQDVDLPLDDPLLQAITGHDRRDDLPDRPGEIDLLFVPEDRRDTVLSADPGAPRLAAWLEARFAAALPGLTASSLGFLQEHFLRRPGRIVLNDSALHVALDPMPLRPVLEMSHLIGEDIARADWLGGHSISVVIREGGP
jgi:hypothetical protein